MTFCVQTTCRKSRVCIDDVRTSPDNIRFRVYHTHYPSTFWFSVSSDGVSYSRYSSNPYFFFSFCFLLENAVADFVMPRAVGVGQNQIRHPSAPLGPIVRVSFGTRIPVVCGQLFPDLSENQIRETAQTAIIEFRHLTFTCYVEFRFVDRAGVRIRRARS